jgi:hypothetical protein
MMFIIAIPESTTFDAMPEALQKTIAKYKGVFADGRLVDTGVYLGKELRLINADIDATTLNAVTNNDLFDEDGNQYGFDLDWDVLAVENQTVDQSVLLNYWIDTNVFDDEGDIIGTEPVSDLTGKIQTWAGKSWVY